MDRSTGSRWAVMAGMNMKKCRTGQNFLSEPNFVAIIPNSDMMIMPKVFDTLDTLSWRRS